MNNPKRYRCDITSTEAGHLPLLSLVGESTATFAPEGEYVLHADYAALQAKADRLDIEVQRLTTALRTCDRILKPMRDKAQKENDSR